MKIRKQLGIIVASLVLVLGLVATTSKAMDWNYRQATKFTFSQPVEIPGTVLPAGTYWFELVDSETNRDTILVFDQDRMNFITSFPSIPDYRVSPVGDTEVTLAEPSTEHPAALLTWFYPGHSIGHEFYYSSGERDRLSEQQVLTVKAEPESSHGVILSASVQ
jgi:hypothetical protein